jgi:RNA polymerase sigma-70 factor (ECF subfamily)
MDPRPSSVQRFNPTPWSIVLAAARSGDAAGRQALEKLCGIYWYPLYAFIRRRGVPPHEAQDLTQGFFGDLLGRDWSRNVDRSQGKFRTFLLACLENYLHKQHARDSCSLRSPSQPIISLDGQEAEDRYRWEPVDGLDPQKLFARRWAMTLVGRVLEELKARYTADGKGDLFQALHSHLTGDAERGEYATIAARLGSTEGAVRVATTRLRADFRAGLRAEILRTVGAPAEVEEEIAHLFGLFS